MAIAQMAKVIIVSHRTQASQLLEALQRDGICQILNAEEAMLSKDWPELSTAAERPRDIEQLLGRLEKSIAFLKSYAESTKGLASVLSPRTVVDEQSYEKTVADEEILKIIEQCEQTEAAIEKLNTECEHLTGTLQMLAPWQSLETPVQEFGRLQQTTALAGLLPNQQLEQTEEKLGELGAVIQQIGTANSQYACLVLYDRDSSRINR